MDNKLLDVSGDVAKVARIAMDEVLFNNWRPPPRSESRRRRPLCRPLVQRWEFIDAFVRAAGDNMARPERIEDIEHFTELAVDQLLADPDLRDSLVRLIKSSVRTYMEPQ